MERRFSNVNHRRWIFKIKDLQQLETIHKLIKEYLETNVKTIRYKWARPIKLQNK